MDNMLDLILLIMGIAIRAMDYDSIIVFILTATVGIIGYFLTRVFKMIDKMDMNIEELGKEAGSRDVKLGVMDNDITNKHTYLNEKIDSINDNMRELIVEIKILTRDMNSNNDNMNNNNRGK